MAFAFKAVPPTSFEDITLDFEQIGYTPWTGDVSGVFGDLKVETVLGGQVPITAVTALGGVLSGTLPDDVGFGASALAALGIARGQMTLTWAGNAYSNEVVITHDLGAVPTYIGVSDTASGGPYICAAEAIGWTATQATCQAAFVNGATWTGIKVFGWLAVL